MTVRGRETLRDRLLKKLVVDLDGPRLVDDAPCWIWQGPGRKSTSNGYAKMRVAGKTVRAHRVAYELWFGPIEPGLTVDHLCHNADPDCTGGVACQHRACCNPAHLEAVPQRINLMRGKSSSPESRAKMSAAAKGKVFSAERRSNMSKAALRREARKRGEVNYADPA